MVRVGFDKAKNYGEDILLAIIASGMNPDGSPFEMPTEMVGRNEIVADGSATFADSAAVNTPVTIDVPLPGRLQANGLYSIFIYNPSGATALNVSVQSVENIGGGDRFGELETFTVPAGGTVSRTVQGFLLGMRGRLVVSNATALGLGQGFTAHTRVRAL